MAPVIRIDDQVMDELKKRAIGLDLVFDSPNAVLRRVLGLKAAGTGTGSGSYVSRPERTADLLAQVGSHVMFKEDTSVTIDKQAQTIPAGTTFKGAWEYSANGGWRNKVRMAILKEAGLV